MKIFSSILFFCCASLAIVKAQQPLAIATNFKKAYAHQTRNADGSPGKNYWQNGADYQIALRFDPASRVVDGTVHVKYFNRSPDTLNQVVFKLYPNLYQAEAMRNTQVSPQDLSTGVDIKKLLVNTREAAKNKVSIRGTNMYLKGLQILPGAVTEMDISYSYQLNKGSFNRTGQVDSGAFVLAYFFPRVTVYDDIDGWNQYPYIGKEEFYNDYSNFKVAISVPGDYAVWATGELKNPSEVYQSAVVRKIALANKTDSVTTIIDEAALRTGKVLQPAKVHTWHFEAEHVTDFAFTMSNHYIWKAASIEVDRLTGRRTRVDAVYHPAHHQYDPVVGYARTTVELISYKLPAFPFPYAHETIFEGLDAMEYPMMVNNLPFDGAEAVEFTAHEVFHSLFPFYVANNETKYSFMDEGLATLTEFTFGPLIAPHLAEGYDLSSIDNTAGNDQDVPVMTLTPQLYGTARFSDKDLKPALGLRYVRELLGEEVFNKALQYYIRAWAGKHPTPYDFFNCINKGAGMDLNWFWQNWFFEKNVPDLAITSTDQASVTVTRIGEGMVPVHLQVLYRDGTTRKIDRAIDCWKSGAKSIRLALPDHKPVLRLSLGDGFDADIDRTNNEIRF